MSLDSFSAWSAISRPQHLSGQFNQAESTASRTAAWPTSFDNSVNLDDLVSGYRPEFHRMIGHHAATAMAYKGGADRQQKAGDQTLQDLLKKVLEDGAVTPQEVAQLRQALSANAQTDGAGAGGCHPSGTHHCSHGGWTGTGAGTAPTTSADQPGAGDPTSAPTPAVVVPSADVAPAEAPAGASFTLGSTQVSIRGGTAAEQQKTRMLFEDMYQKDGPFKKGIDSKAAIGLNVTIEGLPPNIEGEAQIGGNTMSLSPRYMVDTNDFANTIAHELAHDLGMQHGAPLEAFAAEAAAVTA